MLFEDVFPYDKNKYSLLIGYFNRSISGNMPAVLEKYANGAQYRYDSCGLNLPEKDDCFMLKGPAAWAGNPNERWIFPDDYDVLDFKMFIVCFELAVRVYLFNGKGMEQREKMFVNLKRLREKYTNIEWIIEHCYGEEYYVCDDEGICTGEHHDKAWGEKWYEKYGRRLNFDDIDEIVNAHFNIIL